ncbi:Asp-tRNA(Asn)/Glu-tRNA(Gln) amidotransferase A subunit family amidase [Rhizobium sp. BK313]|uniref:amidase n=1 Tax=Rhizobium sp. BK313 TaxID=2587081 RepID=UPI00105D7A6D|nr:amidase [Rhizobium sp. BK313]MBB3459022.1 Asp-tRNA(Asn)/Glu-tRNA(Gln) amidotransferase A subunit family amidase [Rhizobium sp. BK313]
MTTPLPDYSAVELARLLRDGEIGAEELTAACLDRIAALEPGIKAWTFFDADRALRAAGEADSRRAKGEALGVLHGLPVGIKDTYDTLDMPTEFGTPIHRGRQPSTDATMVDRLRRAGAIILGKTVTSEYAVYTAGPTRNPHDLTRTPGGSSSGSAAAVASGMVPLSLATQTNGSTIRPASFCGVVGYKPGLGLLSRTGILKQSDLLDQPGLMARTVADVAMLSAALGGADAADHRTIGYPALDLSSASTVQGRPPRLAFIRSPYWNRLDDDAAMGLEGFVAGLGGIIEEVELPHEFDQAASIHATIMGADIAAAYADDYHRAKALMSDTLVTIIEKGALVSASTLAEAFTARDRLLLRFTDIAAKYDAIITPAARGIAPKCEDGTGDPIMATVWTLLGLPAISLPLLTGFENMPLGVQLVSGQRDDRTLLRAAAWLDRHCRSSSFNTASA